jgi:hypothetical protein
MTCKKELNSMKTHFAKQSHSAGSACRSGLSLSPRTPIRGGIQFCKTNPKSMVYFAKRTQTMNFQTENKGRTNMKWKLQNEPNDQGSQVLTGFLLTISMVQGTL